MLRALEPPTFPDAHPTTARPYLEAAQATRDDFYAAVAEDTLEYVLRDMTDVRFEVPRFIAEKCTGCAQCWVQCPDSAIPGLVSSVEELVDTAIRKAGGGTAVLVGDSVWDVEAGNRAGIPTIGVLSGGTSRDELATAGAAVVVEDVAELLSRVDELLAPPPAPVVLPGGEAIADTIDIKDFIKVDLRIAKIVSCEAVEGSDKLLRLTLDVGEGRLRKQKRLPAQVAPTAACRAR